MGGVASGIQSGKEHHGADILWVQFTAPLWKVHAKSAEPLSFLHNFRERFWQGLSWRLMGKYKKKNNTNDNNIRVMENLYDRAQSIVLFNYSTEEWFKTTVGVKQDCLLSQTLFNIFLERFKSGTLQGHERSFSIGRRLTCITVNILKFRTLYSIQFWKILLFIQLCLGKFSGMANSVDPDLQEQSDLGLHCLHMPFCQQL